MLMLKKFESSLMTSDVIPVAEARPERGKYEEYEAVVVFAERTALST